MRYVCHTLIIFSSFALFAFTLVPAVNVLFSLPLLPPRTVRVTEPPHPPWAKLENQVLTRIVPTTENPFSRVPVKEASRARRLRLLSVSLPAA